MSEYRKLTSFEKICKIFGKIKLPTPKSLESRLNEEIVFCHFEVTPQEVFSTSIFLPATFMFISYIILSLFGLITLDIIASFFMVAAVMFYFLLNYTKFQTIYYRAKFSSEMVLSIIYMAISLQTTRNLERAVSFAANNLSGLLGLDFKKALWNVQSGKSLSIFDELSNIAEKWRKESQEFVDAISILKDIVILQEEQFQKGLNEAIEIVLRKTKTRMKDYAMSLKTPLNIVNSFGVLLPLIAMIFLPLGSIFLPEMVKVSFISVLYVVVLPSIVYLLFRQHFYSRPYSYHQIELSTSEHKRRRIGITIGLFLFLLIVLTPLLIFIFSSSKFSDIIFLASVGITLLTGIAVSIAGYIYVRGLEKVNKKILKFEDELPTASYQLASICRSGEPIESLIEYSDIYMKDLEIKEIFNKASEKIKSGLNLESAFFHEKFGALKDCTSKIIKVVIRCMIDLASKGSFAISKALDSIARFLDDAKDVNKFTDEVLEEVTSEMKITVYIFAPLTSGIVVGLLSMVTIVFYSFASSFQEIEKTLASKEYKGAFEALGWLLNITKTIDLPKFQIVVGFYMLIIVMMISYFLGELKYGEDEVNKIKDISKTVLIAILIYSLFSIGLYYAMKTIITMYPVAA
jgi:Flp pilus assembly protein TadB